MVKVFCDECKAPLDDMPRIMVPQMIIIKGGSQQGQVQGLHFCNDPDGDAKCLRSWLKKNLTRPMIHTPNGPAQ